MTILKLKNLTNIYRIDLKKKLGGSEDTLLSKIYGGTAKWGEKKPEREKKEEEEGSGRKVGRWVKTQARRRGSRRQ